MSKSLKKWNWTFHKTHITRNIVWGSCASEFGIIGYVAEATWKKRDNEAVYVVQPERKKLCSEIISQQLICVVSAPDAKHWGVMLFIIANIYPTLQLNVLYFLKTRSLSGKETRSLPGQETRSLPGQETRSLPGKETRKLPSLSTTHDNQRKWKKLARQTLLM